jgi:S-adenosylmethionine:tRNA ribosyltransferase-isomerase
MRVDLFDFDLPDECIALRPASPRDSARMLCVAPGGALSDAIVRDLAAQLEPGDALVFNDTKVIPAQLEGFRNREDNQVRVSATLHMRSGPDRWKAFVRPGKRIKPGDRLCFGGDGQTCLQGVLDATAGERGEGGEIELIFDLSGPALDEAVMATGHIPLPPYIASKRGEDDAGPQGLPDHLCPRGWRRCRAHRRAAFHRSVCEPRCARHRTAFRHAACRAGDLPAGQGG